MTKQLTEPMEVVDAFIDAFIAMDFDTAMSFLFENVEYTNIPIGTVYGIRSSRNA